MFCMKKIFLFLIILIFPLFYSQAQSPNIGIVEGIWFSKDLLFENEPFRVYVAVQNNSGVDIEGEILFYQNDNLIATKNFSALDGRIIDSWADATAESGKNNFSVKIDNIISGKGGEFDSFELDSLSFNKQVFVHLDTDSDGIPNDDDEDDDGDGYSDKDEKNAGTDPLDSIDIPSGDSLDDTSLFGELFSISDDVSQDELFEKIPKSIQDISEKNNFVKNIALQISNLQNKAEDQIENAQSNIIEQQKQKISESEDISEAIKSAGTTSFISKLLDVLSSIVALWWVFPILIFILIFLLLRILFKVFGKRFRK